MDSDLFEEFWMAYPNKKGKTSAQKVFTKFPKEEQMNILNHIKKRRTTDLDWIKDQGKFIPMPSTFLNQGRHHDEYKTNNVAQVGTAQPLVICKNCRGGLNTQHHKDVCIDRTKARF